MFRGTAALAYSYLLHWLKQEDLYSQQSPFVYHCYLGLVKQLATNLVLQEDPANLASSRFSLPTFLSSSNSPSTPSTPYWKPTQKGISLLAYFCNQTPAQQVLEIGTGNGAITRALEKLPLKKLYSIEENPGYWKQAEGSNTTKYLLGNLQEILPALLEKVAQLDFILINPLFSKLELRLIFESCKPKVHEGSILALAHIHRSTEMENAWKEIQEDPRVALTFDFFDYGIVWFAYPGPKTHLILSA